MSDQPKSAFSRRYARGLGDVSAPMRAGILGWAGDGRERRAAEELAREIMKRVARQLRAGDNAWRVAAVHRGHSGRIERYDLRSPDPSPDPGGAPGSVSPDPSLKPFEVRLMTVAMLNPSAADPDRDKSGSRERWEIVDGRLSSGEVINSICVKMNEYRVANGDPFRSSYERRRAACLAGVAKATREAKERTR